MQLGWGLLREEQYNVCRVCGIARYKPKIFVAIFNFKSCSVWYGVDMDGFYL